jgi:hypothetical protein
MHAVTIKGWFEKIATNCPEWYKQCGSSSATGSEATPPPANWTSFMRGWIHSTASEHACFSITLPTTTPVVMYTLPPFLLS